MRAHTKISFCATYREHRLCFDQAPAIEVNPEHFRQSEGGMSRYLELTDLAQVKRTEEESKRRLEAALAFARAERVKMGERMNVA